MNPDAVVRFANRLTRSNAPADAATTETEGSMAKEARSQFITVRRPSMVKDGKLYFVMRRGGYYKPGAEGYTDNLADAGVWFGKDAKGFMGAEGVTLHPVQPLLPVLRKEIANHIRRAHTLSVLIERL